MNLNFIEDIEAISENFIDYEYISEDSAFMQYYRLTTNKKVKLAKKNY